MVFAENATALFRPSTTRRGPHLGQPGCVLPSTSLLLKRPSLIPDRVLPAPFGKCQLYLSHINDGQVGELSGPEGEHGSCQHLPERKLDRSRCGINKSRSAG